MTEQEQYYIDKMAERTLVLHRTAVTEFGMFGTLKIGGVPQCVTLEPTDKGVVMTPGGFPYLCERVISPTFGETFEVYVKNRSHILFHWGNRQRDSEGCILLGTSFGYLEGEPAILSSKAAHTAFMAALVGINAAFLTIFDS